MHCLFRLGFCTPMLACVELKTQWAVIILAGGHGQSLVDENEHGCTYGLCSAPFLSLENLAVCQHLPSFGDDRHALMRDEADAPQLFGYVSNGLPKPVRASLLRLALPVCPQRSSRLTESPSGRRGKKLCAPPRVHTGPALRTRGIRPAPLFKLLCTDADSRIFVEARRTVH